MINKYTCIIIDDEQYAIELLISRLKILNENVQVLNTYNNWMDGLHGLRSQECDMLFLDISIHEKNGMDLLKFVPNIKSEIIFITAHSEFAINAFKLSATGYILKPIDDVELAHAVDKAIEHIDAKRLAHPAIAPAVSSKLGIPNQRAIFYVDTNDIIYLEAVNTYTKIFLKKEEMVCSYNLGRYKPLLPENMFYQVHRSYIVNLNYVSRYENSGVIVMTNGTEIPVSKNIREDFLKLFGRVIGNGPK